MKQNWLRISAFAFAAALVFPVSMLAQKEDKDKEVKEKKDVEQIIITRKGENKEKVVVEIVGDKITINGKPIEEYKDNEGNVSVRKSRYKNDYESLLNLARSPKAGGWNLGSDDAFTMFNVDSNRAMLGVNTETTDEGVRVTEVNKETAAEKIGLKEGDIITRIDDVKIEDGDDLSKAIRNHKAGDKVIITYLRDKKEQKATAELTKWKGIHNWAYGPDTNFKFNLEDLKAMPRIQATPLFKTPGHNWSWEGGSPKLGLSVQDTDDGKGVKVIEVDEESNAAKAGIKENDVITEVDGKAVNGTDAMVKMIRESKEKTSLMVKLQRGGKTQNIEVKMPRKIKTADL